MHLHAQAMPDDPATQAFLYGPLVLAGDLGGEGLTEAHIIGPNLRVGSAERSAIRFAARTAEYGATRSGDRDPDIPGLGRGSGCLDPAGWTAAGISHDRPNRRT